MAASTPVMIECTINRERRSACARVAIVLALVISLAAIAILSKKQAMPHLWMTAAAVLAPLSIALLFRKEIASLPSWLYVTAVLLALLAAMLFGV